MSSQKKPSIWQRFKNLLTIKQNGTETSDSNTAIVGIKAVDKVGHDETSVKSSTLQHELSDHPANHSNNTNKKTPATVNDNGSNEPDVTNEPKNHPLKGSETANEQGSAKFVHLSDLDDAESTKLIASSIIDNADQPNHSDKPITDSILDYLEASEMNFYYHPPAETELESAAKSEGSKSNNTGNTAAQNVHHISMPMRYYSEEASEELNEHEFSSTQESSRSNVEQKPGTEQHTDKGGLEWGCVIRVHEHTQLVAFYGVLPFNLPESHLQAGIVLATQLNYDMMLGCVEIDIRDGEIRFKNSVDFEPIIEANDGLIPPQVISYLLKGVMAMTASFAPLFKDLLASDPHQFELDTLLAELHQAQKDNTFFLATQVVQ